MGLPAWISRGVIRVLLTSMWVLRRVDYVVNRSTALTRPDAFRDNPYQSFAAIRHKGPVLRSFASRGWLVIGHEAARAALTDPALSNDVRQGRFILNLLKASTGGKPIPFVDNPPLLNLDPPDHSRIRRLVSPGFANRLIQAQEAAIGALIDELLEPLEPGVPFDLIAALAEPLPVRVITRFMGVPDADRQKFQAWSHDLTGATVITDASRVEKAADAEAAMRDYLDQLIETRPDDRGSDFIGVLLKAESDQGRLSRAELIATCILLLTAGHETTTRLIGNTMYHLLNNPDLLIRIRDNPELVPGLIEEVLRLEPPVQMTVRFVKHKTTLMGERLKPGQMVMVNLAAANRDPDMFENPDELRLGRAASHLSFGYGIHLCLGLSLARLEASAAISSLVAKFGQLSGPTEFQWQDNPFFRGLESLPMTGLPHDIPSDNRLSTGL